MDVTAVFGVPAEELDTYQTTAGWDELGEWSEADLADDFHARYLASDLLTTMRGMWAFGRLPVEVRISAAGNDVFDALVGGYSTAVVVLHAHRNARRAELRAQGLRDELGGDRHVW